MNRRTFIHHTTALAASGTAVSLFAKPFEPLPLHLLSKQGCGRASGYAEANKIISAKGKTHVAWIDSPSEGFRVRIVTLNHATGMWSPTYTVGQAKDNHGGPALTIDSEATYISLTSLSMIPFVIGARNVRTMLPSGRKKFGLAND